MEFAQPTDIASNEGHSRTVTLLEQLPTRQVPGDYYRRCFHTSGLQVIVWYEHREGAVVGVELTFEERGRLYVIRQLRGGNPTCHDLDEGRRRDSPILSRNRSWDRKGFLSVWGKTLATLPNEIGPECLLRLGLTDQKPRELPSRKDEDV